MNIKIDISEHDKICNLYKSGQSSYKIAKIYKVCRKTVCDILKKYNNVLRGDNGQRTKDESYFEVIDNQEKAYWLGFLYADGYNNGNGIVLSLQKRDKDIVDEFKKAISSDSSTYIIKPDGKRKNVQDLYCLSVCSKKISKDLTKLGCMKKKSLILKFPTPNQVPEHLMSHFIRGYFDGDGCCCVSKHNGLFISFASSGDFCNKLAKYLKNKLKINTYQSKKKDNNSESLYISGFNQIKVFYDFLYKDANFYMLRKFNKFQEGFKRKELNNEKFLQRKHSRYFGVTWHKRKEKWDAFSCNKGKTINLGSFDNEIDAAKAYNEYAKNNGKRVNIFT